MMEKVTRSNVMQVWAAKFPEVQRWLTHLQKKEQSALFLHAFCEYVHKTPPELLTLKEKDSAITPPPNTVEKMLDDFCGADLEDFTNAERYNMAIQVKSFFKWSYRSLEKASGVVNWEKVKPYNALSKEGLRKLYNMALNPRDRALVPFVTCSGISKETLTNLTWGHLEPDWETKDLPCINIGSESLKGHGKGKYAHVKQITFLSPEAKSALLTYKEWMEGKLGRKLTPQDKVWLETYEPYKPLSYGTIGHTIIALSDRAKVPFSLHDGRRWVTTCLEQIGISSNWAKKIRGRKVRGEDAPYSQPAIEQLRAKFAEAVPLLQFIHEDAGLEQRVQRQEAITQIQSKIMSGEPLTNDDRDKIKRFGIQLRSRAKKRPQCADGENCQKMVSEEELLTYLSQGWEVKAVLPSGKVVIDR